jgi:FAD/FMN-containing dehydrogenase
MPSCIVKPTCAADVVQIISKIVSANCQFAIKGRGHAPGAGFANIDSGITIDMTGLSSVSVRNDYSVASVGAGASWLDVYTFLDPINKTVAGGRNGAVGVGGLTLGGGISYFSPQVGWTCDSVVNFEVVLASGHLVNANSTSHSDLYRALKGGLNNFGVVTRFDFKTLPIGQILAGNIAHYISHRNQVFDAFVTIANAPVYDVHASIVTSLTFGSDKKAWTLSSTPIYTKPDLNPPIYKELFAVPNITNNMRLTELHTLANETATPQIDFLFFTGTYDVSTKLLSRIFDISNNTFYDSEAGTTWLVTFEPLPTVIVSRGAGKNSLGTFASDGNGMVLLLTAIWTNSTYSASIQARATAVMSSINSAAKEMGMLHRFQYANYANRKQKVIESYGTKNKAFLLDVAKRYDPLGVFQNLVPGGLKLNTS